MSRPPRHLAIRAVSYFRDGAVMQFGLLGDLTERKAGGLSVGECLAPRLSHVLSVLLEFCLGFADGLSRLLFGVGGHGEKANASRNEELKTERLRMREGVHGLARPSVELKLTHRVAIGPVVALKPVNGLTANVELEAAVMHLAALTN